MSNLHCPDCGWLMAEHVEVSRVGHAGLAKPRITLQCSNPDCDHAEEHSELTL